MALLGLLPQAEGYLDLLLKEYREDRKRWPLWTYERRPLARTRSKSWYGQLWINRLYWSSLLPLLSVVKDIDAVIQDKGGRLRGFNARSSGVSWLMAEGSPQGDDPGHPGRVQTMELPLGTRLKMAAIFAATADPEPPMVAEDIRLPRRWSFSTLPLDDKDISDLRGSLDYSLSRKNRVPKGSAQPSYSLFLRFIQFEAKAARGKFSDGEAMARERRTLEQELASSVRLTADSRRGGLRITLDNAMGTALREEAEEIIAVVRNWRPESATLSAMREAFGVAESSSRSTAAQGRELQAARGLRFPLLTTRELSSALEGKADKRTRKKLSREWLRARLAADVKPRTLQNRFG